MPTARFLSEADCRRIAATVNDAKQGGGFIHMAIESRWRGRVRWAKNEITDSTETRLVDVDLVRDARTRESKVSINQVDDAALREAVRYSERLLEVTLTGRGRTGTEAQTLFPDDPFPHTKIWSDATYNLDAAQGAAAMRELVAPARAAGMHSFGYIGTSAYGKSFVDSRGRVLYYPATTAEYRVTVRDPAGTGSGWAGQTFSDWSRIDTAKLSGIALDKCLRSRNPVVVEPGRYTAILEPQALFEIVKGLFQDGWDQRLEFYLEHLGKRVADERVTFSQDPLDPDTDMFPFDEDGDPMRKITWIEHGVVRAYPYSRDYAVRKLGKDVGQPMSRAIRMSGGDTSVEEMIATTKRGLLVTRLSEGWTRDGLWLIENGKITKPVKNMGVNYGSPFFVLSNVEQLGTPVRVDGEFVLPPIKVHDFNFSIVTEAI